VVAATILHFLCNAELANEEKGTRSSPKKEIYMANVGLQGSMRRVKRFTCL
jgi:hypothetical protein